MPLQPIFIENARPFCMFSPVQAVRSVLGVGEWVLNGILNGMPQQPIFIENASPFRMFSPVQAV
eukprot:9228718-Prorocentrum_lima.AAC.1